MYGRRVGLLVVGAVVAAGLVLVATPAGADAPRPDSPWPVRTLSAGQFDTCVVLDDGAVKCWGGNTGGQLGLGDTDHRGDQPGEMGNALPTVDLGPGQRARAVGASNEHTCALLVGGDVACWGYNADGRLGLGDTQTRGDQASEMGANLPLVALGSGRTATALAVGGYHQCAILDDGSVKCWGTNFFGQLGQGDNATRGDGSGEMGDALLPVDLGLGRTAVEIAAGNFHSCAILDDGSVKCWGSNASGELGLGAFDHRGDGASEMGGALPAVDLGPGRTATALSLGFNTSCALLDDGSVKCWGGNGVGQAGQGHNNAIGDHASEMGANLPAVDLGPGRTAVAIDTGPVHTCARLDDGSVKCWGGNFDGKLGLGDTANRGDQPGEMGANLPAVDLGPGRHALAVEAGNSHTCARLDDGSVRCWGSGFVGRLGSGNTANRGDDPGEMGSALPAVSLGTPPAPVLEADYRFLRSRLSSVAGAPNLVDAGPGTNTWARERVAAPLRSVLRFPEGNGIDVPSLSSVVPTDHYTAVVLFRIDELDNDDFTGYERIVQWTDDASESGLYAHEGRMEFYPQQSDEATGESIAVDEWVQVAVTRSRIGRLRVYLDGVPTLDFSDDAREGVVTVDDVLRFFRDDTEEDTSGAVGRIRLWNRPLSPAQVAALPELPPAPRVTRSRPSAAQQTTVRIAGSNFGPAEQVRINIRDRRGVTRTLGIPRSNRPGQVTRTIVVPAVMADGPARITLTGLVSQLTATVGLTIT